MLKSVKGNLVFPRQFCVAKNAYSVIFHESSNTNLDYDIMIYNWNSIYKPTVRSLHRKLIGTSSMELNMFQNLY